MSATFVIYVHDFPHGEVSVKVSVMEFGLKQTHVFGFCLTGCYFPSQLADAISTCIYDTKTCWVSAASFLKGKMTFLLPKKAASETLKNGQ